VVFWFSGFLVFCGIFLLRLVIFLNQSQCFCGFRLLVDGTDVAFEIIARRAPLLLRREYKMTIERRIHLYPSSPRRTIKRILFPTDLSPESNLSLKYAVALARTYGARLFVCHCVDKLTDDERERVEENIKELIKVNNILSDSSGLDWEVAVVEGNPAELVVQKASSLQADLIVMSPRRSYTAALLGSTTESICRTAPCPVIITRPTGRELVDSTHDRLNIKDILVGYDFSDQSDWAFSYGLSLAQEYQAKLHLLHVVPIYPENPYSTESLLERAINRLRAAVPAEANSYCKVRQIVREGHPYKEVLTYAREHSIDLICMGSYGSGYAKGALFGSNTDRVLRQSPCPVLVAHPFRWYSEAERSKEARKILLATDGSSYGESVVHAAAARSWPEGTKLRVITVMEPVAKMGSNVTQHRLENEIREALEKVAASSAESLRAEGRIISYVVREGVASDEIVAEAKEWGADLILIGTHGRRGVSRFLLGSVAENVALYAPCSVEIVREPEPLPELLEAMSHD
jgi:nucleotide-binding universal stress UspA family protein